MKNLRMLVLATVAMLIVGCGGGPNPMELAIHRDDGPRVAALLNGGWSKWRGRESEVYYKRRASLITHAIGHGSCRALAAFLESRMQWNEDDLDPFNLYLAFYSRAKSHGGKNHQGIKTSKRAVCARELMHRGRIHPDAYRKDGMTLLQLVAYRGKPGRRASGFADISVNAIVEWPEAMKALLEFGADPNAVDSEGYTLLQTSAMWGRTSYVPLLIAAGADVNAQDPIDGNTALHLVPENYRTIRLALINAGADTSLRNKAGRLAVETTVERQRARDDALREGMARDDAHHRETMEAMERDWQRHREAERDAQRRNERILCAYTGDCETVIHY